MTAENLINWGRAIDKKFKTIRLSRELEDAVFRKTLREERGDLHDEDANTLIKILFFGWARARPMGRDL